MNLPSPDRLSEKNLKMKNKLDFAAIVLAAGKGVRMKSSLPKVLHPIAGQPMIVRTLNTLDQVRPRQIVIVVSRKGLAAIKQVTGSKYTFAIQSRPLGTADAAAVGLKKIDKNISTIAVMYGDDTAFYNPQTIIKVFRHHQKTKPKITFVTVEKEDPTGLGRIIRTNGKVTAIVEEKDATAAQRSITEVNDGLYFFDRRWLASNLSEIKPSRVTGEFYITDLIKSALVTKEKVETYLLRDSNQWYPIDTREALKAANRKITKRIHIMGAAGAGASAIIDIAQNFGYQVTGCDLNPRSPYTQSLRIKITKGHQVSHLKNVSMLVVSPAVLKLSPKNQEVKFAREQGIPILTWQEFQGKYLQKDKFVICVAGAYGKSTTTPMISKILLDGGLDPTCEIGAKLLSWGKNFRVGKSKYYVCEADEYNNNFLNYQPDIAVVLNLDWDHPDYFKNKHQVFESFKKFISKIKKSGHLIIADGKETQELAKFARSDVKVVKVKNLSSYKLSIIGDFRYENANAALAVASVLGIDPKAAAKSIEGFTGVGRRLEYKGKINSTLVYDDYAVQPYTVLKTANALKEKFKDKKVVLVFEPHTFSRIRTFFDDFVSALKNIKIDRVIICNVYAARERGDVTNLAIKLAKSVGPKAKYIGSIEQTAKYLKSNLKVFDVILSMGAGDIYKLYDLVKNLS